MTNQNEKQKPANVLRYKEVIPIYGLISYILRNRNHLNPKNYPNPDPTAWQEVRNLVVYNLLICGGTLAGLEKLLK